MVFAVTGSTFVARGLMGRAALLGRRGETRGRRKGCHKNQPNHNTQSRHRAISRTQGNESRPASR